MKAPAVIDDVLPDFEHFEQLLLDAAAFEGLATLVQEGALTPTAFRADQLGELTYDQYEALAGAFGSINRSCSWWIGDLLNAAEGVHGETFAQIAYRTGLSEQTLLNRKYVCAHVPFDRRVPSLPFSVHAEVAPLSAREQKRWLDRAKKGGWTRDILREHMRAKRKEDKPPLPGADGDGPGSVMEVAYAILRDATPADDDINHLVPNEDIVRLRAALGEEEE
jgi:hypothetical protein